MNKILVDIYLPVMNQSFDVYIPLDSKMGDVVKMTASVLSDLSDGKYQAGEDAVLCDAETGIIFNINLYVAELGLKNGSRLILM